MEKYFHEKNENLISSDSERIRLTTERFVCAAATEIHLNWDICSA